MSNTFIDNFDTLRNYKNTENGALAYKSLDGPIYQMFAQCGAFRSRSNDECIYLFMKAFEQDETMALKCLFWVRDIRGGSGERKFFRVCYKWLAQNHPEAARRNMEYLPFYGRVDDLYCLDGTPLEDEMYEYLASLAFQAADELTKNKYTVNAYEVFKWLKSENCSNSESKRLGNKTRLALGFATSKQYRKFLSWGRSKTKVLETLMSAKHFDEIEFDKIPSNAGLKYHRAFLNNPATADRYKEFTTQKDTKVNANTLYPYEVVAKAINYVGDSPYTAAEELENSNVDVAQREMINKYWENLPDYLEGKPCKILCMVDTSGSMTWGHGAVTPINVSISLGMYCAERLGGEFKDHYISFSRNPQLVKIEGLDFVDKVRRIYASCLCENTDLVGAFELVREISLCSEPEDRPDTIVVISDMEIDSCQNVLEQEECDNVRTEMEEEREIWEEDGLKMPRLVYWNVNAKHDTFLDQSADVSYVSGFSPVLFKQILTGKTGIDLMEETLLSPRYAQVR